MIGVKNFGQIMALRFLLGFLESALVPGLLLRQSTKCSGNSGSIPDLTSSTVTTMWYNPTEMPLRFGLWTVTNGVLPVPMLIIYYGLGHAGSVHLASWQLIFLFLGLISSATGVVLVRPQSYHNFSASTSLTCSHCTVLLFAGQSHCKSLDVLG